ncbi:hypothetical protein CYMTET_42981 [Cymbomonas tetramitiformis]|uniref:Uncharacterized protein n=1 Tax=Cymbomonas tetramitiformis TaxID=36881 RepID=A0AAE0C4Q8_9CHLO|nr:hypothetical protein CYMTET_42981 [Cymbomonas tetramitiformis]
MAHNSLAPHASTDKQQAGIFCFYEGKFLRGGSTLSEIRNYNWAESFHKRRPELVRAPPSPGLGRAAGLEAPPSPGPTPAASFKNARLPAACPASPGSPGYPPCRGRWGLSFDPAQAGARREERAARAEGARVEQALMRARLEAAHKDEQRRAAEAEVEVLQARWRASERTHTIGRSASGGPHAKIASPHRAPSSSTTPHRAPPSSTKASPGWHASLRAKKQEVELKLQRSEEQARKVDADLTRVRVELSRTAEAIYASPAQHREQQDMLAACLIALEQESRRQQDEVARLQASKWDITSKLNHRELAAASPL